MPEARSRPGTVPARGNGGHQSIGEVLATLREEFPDITISKIRFLESQGLIDPERTPSGYRKFYAGDIERLRWILRQQKEHFLPLKVIRGRLEELEALGGPEEVAELEATTAPDGVPPAPADGTEGTGRAERAERADDPAGSEAANGSAGDDAARTKKRRRSGPQLRDDDRGGDQPSDELTLSTSGASLTRAELARAAGLDDSQLEELESYGLISPTIETRDRVLFDEDALAVARLAAGFFGHGVEARHLRMYRTFAEREATLFEQVLLGVLRQRNPEARARAQEQLEELARLGRGLRTAYLRRAVRDALSE